MFLELKTAPAVKPVSRSEAKEHLRISHTADDAYIDALIDAAIAALDGPDGKLRRALCAQTWYAKLDCFPAGGTIRLPVPPLQSVTAITYYDADNALQTLSTDYYQIAKPYGGAGEVLLKYGQTWPYTYERPDAVIVEFVAGYGVAADVPKPIKQALLLMVGDMYANRGDDPGEQAFILQARKAASDAVDALLSRYLWREVVA